MMKVVVEVTTDHTNAGYAISSVKGAMERAGYDVNEFCSIPPSVRTIVFCDAMITVSEPEIGGA